MVMMTVVVITAFVIASFVRFGLKSVRGGLVWV
jgi:hypothetical protein